MGEACEIMPRVQRDALLAADDSELIAQSEVDHYRASGPGGQKRNKTDSAVRLRHGPTGLMVVAVERRSQHENRAKALKRLRRAIALNVRATIDPAHYAPSGVLAQCRTEDGGIHVGMKDARYWPVVAEVLDVLASSAGRMSEAAVLLGLSTGRLSSFLTRDHKVKARVNAMRAALGIKPIR